MSSGSFLAFHVFLSQKITKWALENRAWTVRRRLAIAFGFLAVVAAANLAADYASRPPNFYEYLQVSTSATTEEIKRAYKQRSLQLHPDKNPSPTAAEEFNRLRLAYDTLLDATQRDRYYRYGEQHMKATANDTGVLVYVASFYVLGLVLAYYLTTGKELAKARYWSLGGLAMMLVLEFQMKAGDTDFATSIFTRMTIFEKMNCFHVLFPSFVNACAVWSIASYVDVETLTMQMLGMILHSNQAILDLLSIVEAKQNATSSVGLIPAEKSITSASATADSAADQKQSDVKPTAIESTSDGSAKGKGKKKSTATVETASDKSKAATNPTENKSTTVDAKDGVIDAASQPAAPQIDTAQIRDRIRNARNMLSSKLVFPSSPESVTVNQPTGNAAAVNNQQKQAAAAESKSNWNRLYWMVGTYLLFQFLKGGDQPQQQQYQQQR